MGRLLRSERMALKGRPKRRAAKTHFFKYQLATNPSRAEENDLKRALQESLEEHGGENGSNKVNIVASSINSSDVSRSNISSSSNESARSNKSANLKRTRSSMKQSIVDIPVTKRAKYSATNGYRNKCDGKSSEALVESSSPSIPAQTQNNNSGNNSRAIRTYSRNQSALSVRNLKDHSVPKMKTSTPTARPTFETHDNGVTSKNSSQSSSSVSRSTQTPNVSQKFGLIPTSKTNNDPSKAARSSTIDSSTSMNISIDNKLQDPSVNNQTPFQYLKFKRESKNYAYVKMTALKVSTSKSPSNSKSSSSRKSSSPNGVLHNNSTNKESTKINAKVCASPNNLNSDNNSTSEHSSAINKANNSRTNISKIDVKSLKHSKKSSPTNISSRSSPQNGISPGNKTTTNNVYSKSSQVSNLQRNSIPKHNLNTDADSHRQNNDCLQIDTQDLSKKMNQSQVQVKNNKKRVPQGSWSLLGVPEEKVIYLRDDEPPRRLICYPAIKHVEGDVIQVRDSVLLRSGARKTDLSYIAKVCAFWEDAETGGVMMSLFWYYRPEHTEEGRKPHHLSDEIFASRHRDVDSVECIDDKCYVLTFNEYCRYRKRCKMEQVNTNWSLTDVTIPVSNESYPRRNRIPDSDVNPELVFCCRQIYDSRMRRLVKNPLINPKYGHI